MNMIKKYIMRFLNKKSDFERNAELATLNDQYFYLLAEVKKLLNHVIYENVKYYFRYKKLYLAKLFVIFSLIIMGMATMILGGVYIYNDITKDFPKKEKFVFSVYIPDTDTLSQQYAKSHGYSYAIIFLPDPRKDWSVYKKAMHNIETHGTSDSASYHMRSVSGIHWGRYQLGPLARQIGGCKPNITFEEFTSNPELQEGAFLAWIRFIKDQMQPDINKYSGRFMSGVQITESGIISMAHNAGIEATRNFLNNGTNPPGGLTFLKLGGYNLQLD